MMKSDIVSALNKTLASLEKSAENAERPMTQNPTPKRTCEYNARLHEAKSMRAAIRAIKALIAGHGSNSLPEELQKLKAKSTILEMMSYARDRSKESYYTVVSTYEYKDKTPLAVMLQTLADANVDSVQLEEAKKTQSIQQMEGELRFVKLPGFFPTPKELALDMAEELAIQSGMSLLEPSAGLGTLVEAVQDIEKDVDILTIEPIYQCRDILEAKGFKVSDETDFMKFETDVLFDRIIMNPPFEKQQDIQHIRKAFDLLKPDGRMVALASPSCLTNSNGKATEFRNWLKTINHEVRQLPSGSFKSSFNPTGVNVVMFVIDKLLRQ